MAFVCYTSRDAQAGTRFNLIGPPITKDRSDNPSQHDYHYDYEWTLYHRKSLSGVTTELHHYM